MSRSPPCASLRSGSRLCASSPCRACRALRLSTSCGSRRRAFARQSCETVERAAATTSGSPATHCEVEQADRGGQVARGDGAALVDGADRVVELHAGVPDGVPDPVGQSAQVVAAERAPVVQEHEVDVAERTGVTAGEAADGGERDALGGLAVERLRSTPGRASRGSGWRWRHGGPGLRRERRSPWPPPGPGGGPPGRSARSSRAPPCPFDVSEREPPCYARVRRLPVACAGRAVRVRPPALLATGAACRAACRTRHPRCPPAARGMPRGRRDGARHRDGPGRRTWWLVGLRGRRRPALRCGPGRRPRRGRSRSCRHRSGRSGRT